MAMLTVRNLPDDVHRALRARAARHGRSTEAEVRDILAAAVAPAPGQGMGEAMAAPWRAIGGLTDEEVAIIESARDRTPAVPWTFE